MVRPCFGRKERHVRGDIQLCAGPDRLARGFNIFHAAIRMQPTYTASTSSVRGSPVKIVAMPASPSACATPRPPSTSARATRLRPMSSAATLEGVSMRSSFTGKPRARSRAACSAGG